MDTTPFHFEIRLGHCLERLNLKEPGEEGRVHQGVLKEIQDGTHLSEDAIRRILKNAHPNVQLDTLERLAGWLVSKGLSRNELPGALLAVRPSRLMQAIANASRVVFFLGAYRFTPRDRSTEEREWIHTCDGTAASLVIERLSGKEHPTDPSPPIMVKPVIFHSDGKRARRPDDIENARKLLEATEDNQTTRVFVGSQLANYAVEHFVAGVFAERPFHPAGRNRKVPIYLRYRPGDDNLRSCFGGKAHPAGQSTTESGIYYWDKDAKNWVHVNWEKGKTDAGVIVVVYHPKRAAADVLLFGLSGYGTRAIGEFFSEHPDRYWHQDGTKPVHEVHGAQREIRIYVCKVTFKSKPTGERGEAKVELLP